MKVSLKTYDEVLRTTLLLLQKYFGKDILSFAVFGSVARGEASPLSDIDLLIIHQKCNKDMMAMFTKLVLELRKTQEYKRLQAKGFYPEPYPLFIDEEKLKKRPWILLDILDHGVILFDEKDILKKELNNLSKHLKQLGSKKIVLPDGSWYWDLKPDWKLGEVVEL